MQSGPLHCGCYRESDTSQTTPYDREMETENLVPVFGFRVLYRLKILWTRYDPWETEVLSLSKQKTKRKKQVKMCFPHCPAPLKSLRLSWRVKTEHRTWCKGIYGKREPSLRATQQLHQSLILLNPLAWRELGFSFGKLIHPNGQNSLPGQSGVGSENPRNTNSKLID
jgi:hypothetical protein